MPSYWFGDVDSHGCLPAGQDVESRAKRVIALSSQKEPCCTPDWQQAVTCGTVRDRQEYLEALRQLCFHIAEQKIGSHYRGRDIDLVQMVRTLDQLDEVINLLTERTVDWYRTRNPGFSRKYRWLPGRKMIAVMKRDNSGSFRQVIDEIERLSHLRSTLMREVSSRAVRVLPNCSTLIGGLVAARLVERAGGLHELSRLPASAIQVLGARTALFSHMRSGTPSPKHGIIFQHQRVHAARREVRGRVARTLAAKLAIAARLDYYREEAAPEFLSEAQAAVNRAGAGHDMD
jgi:nucleolar protein 56